MRAGDSRWRRIALGGLASVNVGLIVLGIAIALYENHYQDRIYAGVSVLGVHLGGLSRDAARARLGDSLQEGTLPYIVLYSGAEEWVVAAEELGGYLDLKATVDEAWTFGRGGLFRTDLVFHMRALWRGYDVSPVFRMDPGIALDSLRRIARLASHPLNAPQIGLQRLQVRADLGTGYDLDVTATRQRVTQSVADYLGTSRYGDQWILGRVLGDSAVLAQSVEEGSLRIPLVFREIASPMTSTEDAEKRLEALLSTPMTLSADLEERLADGGAQPVQRTWIVDRALLASWLTITPAQSSGDGSQDGAELIVGVDRDKVRAYLERLSVQIDRPPREARFDFDPYSGQLTALCPGQDGYALDIASATSSLSEACLTVGVRNVVLPVHIVPPRVAREDLEALMPLSLISVGQSDFTGSTPDRLQNIKAATARFHGLVVPPRSGFSFLDYLGHVTVANGYTQSWIILGRETILGPGGGVCQVSTTCFRAAFWGGFPIVERWPHTYRVSWYEPPLGLDAAVFSPDTDMQFTNDLDTPILILTEVDEANAKLYFRFYGAPLERTVSMEGPITANPVPAGPSVIIQDSSLAPGQRVVEEWAHDGIDVTIYRIVEGTDGTLVRDEIFSRYVPWAGRYRVGPPAETP